MARERRKNLRVEWHSSGTIYNRDGDTGCACVVEDLSNGGAKISGVTATEVPDQFTLRIEGELKTRKCHVLWRKADVLGVEFTDRFPIADKPSAGRAKKTRRPAHA
jgi:hypothetical protein